MIDIEHLNDKTTILKGIVGSQAYGLATPESDTDYVGVFTYPPERAWVRVGGSNAENDRSLSVVTKDPDCSMHELTKAVKLMAKGNPAIVELLWLPDELYVETTPEGRVLLQHRDAITSQACRNAYVGYGRAQVKRLEVDGKPPTKNFGDGRKYVRHMVRLMLQCEELLATGRLEVKLAGWQVNVCRELEEADYAEVVMWMSDRIRMIDSMESDLRPEPDWDAINKMLIEIRLAGLHG